MVKGKAIQRRFRKAASDLLYTRFIPSKKGSVFAIEPALLFALHQELGSQHRRKGQCGKRGDDDRTGYYDTELTEQTSRHTVHKYDGKEYRYQRNGGRDYGKEDFFGSLDTGLFRGHSFFDADVDVLRHYNGIINHKTHCQHNSQHGEHVDGEVRQIHNEESTDQRYRNHDAGNQCNTPVAQKKEDDDDDKEMPTYTVSLTSLIEARMNLVLSNP